MPSHMRVVWTSSIVLKSTVVAASLSRSQPKQAESLLVDSVSDFHEVNILLEAIAHRELINELVVSGDG